MIRAVAFDMDSTLTDFLRYKRAATEAASLAMVDAGLELEPGIANTRLWETYRETGLDGDVAFERFLRTTVGRVDAHVLHAGIAAYQRVKHATLEPYPRTLDTLLALSRRGLRLAVITDAERHKALQRLAAIRLGAFFEFVITADDTLRGKADEQPFRLLLKLLQMSAKDVLMVGDNPARDIRPARRLGMPTALAAYGAQPHFATLFPDDRADHVLRRIDDLLPLVEGRSPPPLPLAAVALPEVAAAAEGFL